MLLATIIKKLWTRTTVEIVGLIIAIVIGIGVHAYFAAPKIVTVQTTPTVKTVTVDVPTLTEKTLTKIISDPKDKALIVALLAENAQLKLAVTSVTQTTATETQTGSGPVETVAATPTAPAEYHFKDWHLDFTTDTKTANYTLHQKFEILTSTGKDKDGHAASLVKLYELGANNERIPVTDLQTVGIFADQTSIHWMLHLNVQAGLAATRDSDGKTSSGGVIVVQWLKRGRTTATEDTSYNILSPAVFLAPGVQDIGILPVSVNIGRLPHQPFTNLWLSPFVALSKRVGVTVTATF